MFLENLINKMNSDMVIKLLSKFQFRGKLVFRERKRKIEKLQKKQSNKKRKTRRNNKQMKIKRIKMNEKG